MTALACPFCGDAEPVVEIDWWRGQPFPDLADVAMVLCRGCGAKGPDAERGGYLVAGDEGEAFGLDLLSDAKLEKAAVAAWNKRARRAALPEGQPFGTAEQLGEVTP